MYDTDNFVFNDCYNIRRHSKEIETFPIDALTFANPYTCEQVLNKGVDCFISMEDSNCLLDSYQCSLLPHAYITGLLSHLLEVKLDKKYIDIIEKKLYIFDNFIEREKAFDILIKYGFSFYRRML